MKNKNTTSTVTESINTDNKNKGYSLNPFPERESLENGPQITQLTTESITAPTETNAEPRLPSNIICESKVSNNVPPRTFRRNEYGLLENFDYIFSDDGTVNWRSMIPPQFLYLNPQHTERIEKEHKKKISEISVIEDKVKDRDLVITLQGIRYLAFLRGFTDISYSIHQASNEYASIVCRIYWIPNYETPILNPEAVFDTIGSSGVGSANLLTTNQMTKNYLVEMAENRAFCRAVRGFLRIGIVSAEELSPKNNNEIPQEQTQSISSPATLLASTLEAKGISFDKMKATLIAKGLTEEYKKRIQSYNSVNDIPTTEIFDILGKIKAKEATIAARSQ
jgi:hypothetical protein